MMRCTKCGGQEFSTTYEDFPLAGLPDVVLSLTRKKVCESCEEYRRYIPRHARMTQQVTIALLNKRRLLAPGEIKWLRSHLGVTSAQMALLLKVSQTTVSYWENGKRKPSQTSDLLLRLLVSTTLEEGAFSFQAGLQVRNEENAPLQLKLHFQDSDWKVAEGAHEGLLVVDLAEPGWGSWSTPQWLEKFKSATTEGLLEK